MADLRVEVALAILNSDRKLAGFPPVARLDSVRGSEGYLTNADAVIGVFVDMLRAPSEEALSLTADRVFHLRADCDSEGNRSMLRADVIDKVVEIQEWRASLAEFRAEQAQHRQEI